MTDKQEMILRELLWLKHGHSIWELYGDDGEMQCHNCMLDFKRDSVERIKERFDQIAFDNMMQTILEQKGKSCP